MVKILLTFGKLSRGALFKLYQFLVQLKKSLFRIIINSAGICLEY